MKKYKLVNPKRLMACIATLISVIVFTIFVIDFYSFPEKYITTWKYQLECKIKQGDQEAIDYYNRVYIQNDENLFE